MTSDRQQVTSNTEKGYRRLIAWKLADEFVHITYKFTDKFPKDEIFGLTSQLRRASLSVVLNIVEGHSRNNNNEFRSFLRISLGSLAESEYLLEFAFDRKYITKEELDCVLSIKDNCGRVLWKLMKSI